MLFLAYRIDGNASTRLLSNLLDQLHVWLFCLLCMTDKINIDTQNPPLSKFWHHLHDLDWSVLLLWLIIFRQTPGIFLAPIFISFIRHGSICFIVGINKMSMEIWNRSHSNFSLICMICMSLFCRCDQENLDGHPESFSFQLLHHLHDMDRFISSLWLT
jgi:hypothetical protein